jgi:DNA (cytosine-5)-methyltransferase 1
MLTLTDLFCGAGGSSTGAVQIPGVEVRVASNHWQLAIETHNSNHQDADHICADLSQIDPRYFPRTDLLWASPECTNHSRAKGRKKPDQLATLWDGDTLPDEAAERSRATMWDVVRFTEAHRYQAVIVENVVEAVDWPPFHAWLMAMDSLGYEHQLVSLNSMHAQSFGMPAPQSRDRLYVVFHRKGNRRPDIPGTIRPIAYCSGCDELVHAVQSFKKPDTKVGRYRQQYVWRCPSVRCRNQVVEPGWLPAASIIDWSLKGQRIGDRAKPLAEKTRKRIAAGIARYWSPIHSEAAGNTYDAADPKHAQHGNPNSYYRAWSVDEPLRTLHTIESKALAVPVEGRADMQRARTVEQPLRTQNTRLETGLAFVMDNNHSNRGRTIEEPMPTQTTATTKALVQHPFMVHLKGSAPSQVRSSHSPVNDPLHTVAANGNHHALVTSYYGNNDSSKPTSEPLDTVTTTDRHALLTPAGGTWNDTAYPAAQPARTMTTRETTALIMRNNGSKGDGAEMVTRATEVARTITTAGHQSVLTPGDIAAAEAQVDDVLFRMLEPSECKKAMAFPNEYVMLGNRREQVKLAGNAVTPPAARDLIACVVASLMPEVAA